MNGETLTGLLKKGQMILAQAGIKEAGLDAWLLLEYVTGKSRAYYFAYGEESVTESVAERYLELISRGTESGCAECSDTGSGRACGIRTE